MILIRKMGNFVLKFARFGVNVVNIDSLAAIASLTACSRACHLAISVHFRGWNLSYHTCSSTHMKLNLSPSFRTYAQWRQNLEPD